MKLLIAGSRSIAHFDLSTYVPAETELIISGGAKGIDTVAEEYADAHHIPKMIFCPRYDLYGKAAPLKRNEEMVELADTVLVVWDGSSAGTKHTISLAKRKKKPLIVVSYEDVDGRIRSLTRLPAVP